jgi:hypothetical protein
MNIDFQNITPTDLRDFAKFLGWQQLAEAIADGLFVLSNPHFERRQLVFPMSADAPDYTDAVTLTLNKLAEIQSTPINVLVNQLLAIKDDALSFKVIEPRNETSFIPLTYAAAAINGTKEILLAAASSVLRPQVHHPRLSRSEAYELVEKSKFRHTEKGSFIINVSTPVRALDVSGNLYSEDIPFVRQTTLAINHGISKLVRAIQADTLDTLVDQLRASANPEISSNLCKAITSFQEAHNDFDLFIDFKWSGTVPMSTVDIVPSSIKIQKEYFSRIDDVRRELKATEEQNIEEVFMASVEHLAGDIGNDGRRSGEVILNLYKEGEIIRARTALTAEQYADADTSHMTADSYIKIKGMLRPGNQPRTLNDISSFELIRP